MSCELIAGNEAKAFFVMENENKDCEIRVRAQKLDYETQSKYLLTAQLQTPYGLSSQSRQITQVTINIADLNDNRPVFIVPARYAYLTGDRYVAAIARDAPPDSQVIQLQAKDEDSGQANAALTYEIIASSDPKMAFKIDSLTGILRTRRSLEGIDSNQLPLRIKCLIRDNPPSERHALTDRVEVVIDLIDETNRWILVLEKVSPGQAQEMRKPILK